MVKCPRVLAGTVSAWKAEQTKTTNRNMRPSHLIDFKLGTAPPDTPSITASKFEVDWTKGCREEGTPKTHISVCPRLCVLFWEGKIVCHMQEHKRGKNSTQQDGAPTFSRWCPLLLLLTLRYIVTTVTCCPTHTVTASRFQPCMGLLIKPVSTLR